MALASRLGLVTFDATNTLMQLSRPVGTQYRELLAARLKLGSDAAAAASDGGGSSSDLLSSPVSEEGIEASFLRAYKERAAELSCFGAGVCSAQEWWRPLVRNTFVGAGVDEGALCDEGALFQPLFEDLWRHFAGPKAWELLPGAQELLIALDGHRHAGGLRVGVVSDWDNRLPELLASIGVAQHCDFINAAFNIGHAKPARAAFDAAREAAGGVSAAEVLHIGDSLGRDVRGALAAGMHAVHLGPVEEGSEAAALLEEYAGTGRLHVCEAGLAGLPQLLGIAATGDPAEAAAGGDSVLNTATSL
jgi:FMN phosphatase YigB (HAD superfamily)